MKSCYKFQNFGINNKKTIDEKYTLLWEVFSDSHFQNVFVVDVLQKQNKERGFDVMIRLNTNLNLFRIFNE
uniref:Bm14338 n=1 Tax=Brugia malayi TaxID=6279 RepID=A0A0J9YG52_BRUMA|nr:Bm14338 [Brugia malayi]